MINQIVSRVSDHYLWVFQRICRQDRRVLGEVSVDDAFLKRCADDRQAMLIDRCPLERAVRLLSKAVQRDTGGLIWAVAGTDESFRAMRLEAESMVESRGWRRDHVIHDAHPAYMDSKAWGKREIRILLTASEELLANSRKNPRKRQDVLRLPIRLLAIIDTELGFICKRGTWDPAFVIRDMQARLSAEQGPVAMAIFTERDCLSALPERVCEAFGVDGLLYLDGSTGR